MAVYSMTGYASRQSHSGRADDGALTTLRQSSRLELEIRSVNSRFLDLSFRLPDDMRAHEPWLRDLLRSNIKRGKVELRLQVQREPNESLSQPSPAALQKLSALQAQILGWLPQAQALTVADILRLGSSSQADQADRQAELQTLAQATLADFLSAREREGASLCTMMQERIQQLKALSKQAEPLTMQAAEQQRQRFLERWKEAVQASGASTGGDAMQERALAEVTAYALRIDVAEELSRLKSHLDELERLLTQGGEIGKRLEFLIQELHREANTLGSKSVALSMTQVAVDMKVLIEQLREQVQNIE